MGFQICKILVMQPDNKPNVNTYRVCFLSGLPHKTSLFLQLSVLVSSCIIKGVVWLLLNHEMVALSSQHPCQLLIPTLSKFPNRIFSLFFYPLFRVEWPNKSALHLQLKAPILKERSNTSFHFFPLLLFCCLLQRLIYLILPPNWQLQR